MATVVTARQMRIALHRMNLLNSVQIWVENADNPEVNISWEYTTEFYRDNPMVTAVKAALGKTDEEIDELFLYASTL